MNSKFFKEPNNGKKFINKDFVKINSDSLNQYKDNKTILVDDCKSINNNFPIIDIKFEENIPG